METERMKRAKSNRPKDCPYVGKGGLKLKHALDKLALKVADLVAADLGCQVGGFSDCLLQEGASRVYAVDTAYGVLAWKLRTDSRIIVLERTNALHWSPPELLDLIVIDLGWTRQDKSLAAAATMVKPEGEILSLVKPQYEVPKEWLTRGVLPTSRLKEALELVKGRCPEKLASVDVIRSPYVGSGGNVEFWMRLMRRRNEDECRDGSGARGS